MSEHLAPERMNRYAFRALEPEALLEADDHLAGCPDCRGKIVDEDGLRATVRALGREVGASRLPEPDHLSYEAVEAMAENRLRGAAREVAEMHVEGCPTCSAEIADLRGFVAAHREARRAAAAAVAAAHLGRTPDAGHRVPEIAARGAARSAPVPSSSARPGHAAAGGAAAGAAVDAGEAADVAPGFDRPARDAGAPDLFSLTLPSARPRGRKAAVAVAVAVTLLLAAGAGLMATRTLRRERDDLSGRLKDLTAQNEALAARADEMQKSRADLEQAAAAARNAPPAPVTLHDRRGKDEAISVGLDAEGMLTGLDTLSQADARVVATALRRGAVEVPAEIVALGRDDSDAAPGPRLTSPVGVAIRGIRPTFAWQPLEGAASYTFVLLEESGEVAMRGGPTRNTKWTPPRSLRRGASYVWSVTAQLPAEPADPAAPGAPAGGAPGVADAAAETGDAVRAATAGSAPARFRVLDAEGAAGLDRALRGASGSRLAGGIFLARAGLLDQAIAELRALAEANPDSDLARSLLASVESAHTAR